MSKLRRMARSTASLLIAAVLTVGIGQIAIYFGWGGESFPVKVLTTFVSFCIAGGLVFIASRSRTKTITIGPSASQQTE